MRNVLLLAAIAPLFGIAPAFAQATGAKATAPDPAIPVFVEETAAAGIDHVYSGDWEYMVGGGVAAFDCNDDSYPDLFMAGGESPARFYRNASDRGGALNFAIETSGLEIDRATGAYPVDIDSDGKIDLVVLRVGENVVMRGLGGCRFERANEAWGFDGGKAWSAALSATWERGASWPTLAIGNYVDPEEELEPWGSCTDNWLHRPAADRNGFAPPLPLTPSFCALSILFTDWNLSGTPSLRVSNDREYYEGGQEQMWHVRPGEPPRLYTEAEGWKRVRIWGMGIATADVTRDGYPDYFLTSMADNRLQTLASIPTDGSPRADFKEIAHPRGLTAHRPYTGEDQRPSTAWHAQFEDVNNDGLPDLLVVKGNVAEMPDFAAEDPNNLLLQRADGTFMEAGDKAGVASMAIGRGGALTDLNLDGLVDLVVVNRWTTAQIWRNTGTSEAETANWVQVGLRQPGPNRDAIGAWLEVRSGDTVQRREIVSGGGHASGQIGWWHAGLGAAQQAEIRVLWPDGEAGPWQAVTANGFHVVERGSPPRAWVPAR